jgi:glycoside/pentoside/hexuronide:cation symporter, GPH family
LIGQASDRLHSPWGRRHPFMYAAALPVALSYAAIWNPPHWSHGALLAYLIVSAIVIRTFTSFYEVPSSALAAEFSTSYDERSVLLSYRFFFGWVGGLGIQAIALLFLLRPDRTHPVGQLNPVGWGHYGLLAAAMIFVAIVISTAGTHHRIPTLRAPPPRRRLSLAESADEMASTLSERSFLFLLGSGVTMAMAAGLAASLNSYFTTFFWGFSARQISLLTFAVFISAMIALPLAPLLSRRFGKRATAITLIVMSVSIGIGPLILRVLGLFPTNESPWVLRIILCTSVTGVTCTIAASTMLSAMIADVVEAAELRTGRRSEGLLFAASAFVGKAVSGFGILGASIIVEMIHLRAGVSPTLVPASVLRELALIYVPTLIVLYAIALTAMLGYRITRSSHEDTLRELAAKSEELAHPPVV